MIRTASFYSARSVRPLTFERLSNALPTGIQLLLPHRLHRPFLLPPPDRLVRSIRRPTHDALHPRRRARGPDVVHPAPGPRQRTRDARRLRRAAQRGLRGRVRRGTASRRGWRARACAPTDRAVPRAPTHRAPDTPAPPPPRPPPRTPHQVPAGTRVHAHRVRDQLTGAR